MSIKVSKKHGVNPSVQKCWLCGESKGLVLFGRLPKDEEAPMSVVMDKEPCDKCKEYMKMGIIFIQVKDDDKDYRLGGFAVVKEEVIPKIMEKEMADSVLKSRVCFVADSVWKMMNIPTSI